MHPRICLARILALTQKLSATQEANERQAIMCDLDFYFAEMKAEVLRPQGPCVKLTTP